MVRSMRNGTSMEELKDQMEERHWVRQIPNALWEDLVLLQSDEVDKDSYNAAILDRYDVEDEDTPKTKDKRLKMDAFTVNPLARNLAIEDDLPEEDDFLESPRKEERKSKALLRLEKERDKLRSLSHSLQSASMQAGQQGGSLVSSCFEAVDNIIEPCLPPVFMPTDTKLMRWDLVIAGCLGFVALLTPVDVAFIETKLDFILLINRILDLMFLMDMCLQFNLATPNKFGRLMKTRREIRDKYLSGWFFIDFLSILPWDVVELVSDGNDEDDENSGGTGKMFRFFCLLRLLKMLRLVRGLRIFGRFEARYALNYSALQLNGFLLLLFLLCHWLACGWYLMISIEGNAECFPTYNAEVPTEGKTFDPHNWSCCFNWFDCYMFKNAHEGPSIARKYFLSFVWATGEVLTVGSTINEITDGERAYMVIARVISGVTYAYLLGSVCSIFTSMTKKQSFFYESMDKLNTVLTTKLINVTDPDLCSQLRVFYRFASGASDATDLSDILNTLSPSLRGALSWKVHKDWLGKLDIFENIKLPQTFFIALSNSIQVQLFAPLEPLIETHHPSTDLFCMDRGIALVKGGVRSSGQVFGEDCLSAWRNHMERGYQAKAFTHGSYYTLSVDMLFVLMRRQQYAVRCKKVVRRILKLRLKSLMLYFYRLTVTLAEAEEDYLKSCEHLRDALGFVDTAALPKVMTIFARLHMDINPHTAHRTAIVVKFAHVVIDLDDIRQNELAEMLRPYAMEHLAQALVVKEGLDKNTLIKLTPVQLHACGAPMAKAIQFAEAYATEHPEDAEPQSVAVPEVQMPTNAKYSHQKKTKRKRKKKSSGVVLSPRARFETHPVDLSDSSATSIAEEGGDDEMTLEEKLALEVIFNRVVPS